MLKCTNSGAAAFFEAPRKGAAFFKESGDEFALSKFLLIASTPRERKLFRASNMKISFFGDKLLTFTTVSEKQKLNIQK